MTYLCSCFLKKLVQRDFLWVKASEFSRFEILLSAKSDIAFASLPVFTPFIWICLTGLAKTAKKKDWISTGDNLHPVSNCGGLDLEYDNLTFYNGFWYYFLKSF